MPADPVHLLLASLALASAAATAANSPATGARAPITTAATHPAAPPAMADATPAAAPESRPPSEAERRALQALLKREHGADAAGLAEPQFTITRAPEARRWQVRAAVPGEPKAGWKNVCHQRRAEYAFGPRGWQKLPQPSAWVWLGGRGCTSPAAPVHLRAPLADTEIQPLLERQRALGERMRVLMIGNSECASQRGLGFTLAALDVSNPAGRAELMPMLAYRSHLGTEARLFVRRNGAGFDPWTVACPRADTPPGQAGRPAGAERAPGHG